MTKGIKSLLNRSTLTWSLFLSSAFVKRAFSFSFKMQALRSDGLGGRGVTYVPSSGSYKNVVVWMHGLGDTADGWASMMPSLGISETKFILPTATNRAITINGGYAMPGIFTFAFHFPLLIRIGSSLVRYLWIR